MVGWHHQFDGHELGQTLGDSQGEGGLQTCSLEDCIGPLESMGSLGVGHDLATEQQQQPGDSRPGILPG